MGFKMTKSRCESMEEPDKRDRRIRNSLGIQQTWAVLPSLCVPWEPDFSIIFSRVLGLRVLRVSSSENQISKYLIQRMAPFTASTVAQVGVE